jgi:hypothetical protein
VTALRLLAATALAAGACLAGAAAAHAETGGLPVGSWITADLRKELVVDASGHCTLKPGRGQLDIAGSCTWEPRHNGGTLTIFSDSPTTPDPVPYPVLWFGDTAILLNYDVYNLRT